MRSQALSLGATEFGNSKAKNKRYYVIYQENKLRPRVVHSSTIKMKRNARRGEVATIRLN